jgi:transcription termination/antitermination protein NusG
MMEHSEDDHVDQPALTDDELDTAPESAAVARAEELAEEEAETAAEAAEEELEEERGLAESVEREVEDEPTSSADDLSGRAGGPELAEEVEAVVDEEVVDGEEEATFEAEVPDVARATGAADPETEEAVSDKDEQPLGSSDDVADLEDAEPKEVIEPGDTVLEVEPELAAAVEEAFDEADVLAEGEAEPEPEFLPGEWYVVHTYAGYENKVKADLETRVASMNMEEQIYEVVIPMEEVVEVKGGKKQTVQRKVFPGYLLVRMELSDDSWYVVRNTPGVTGFVGSGTKPIPLSEREVDKILKRKGEAEKPRPKAEWQTNDPVRVTTGPFANFQGVISEVDDERQKVKVLVNIFGRETPVELSYDQISKV